jgi:hypothetical protein
LNSTTTPWRFVNEAGALLVNVPNRTVFTALDQSEMQKRVFTQIDSAMTLYWTVGDFPQAENRVIP